jgi:tripartite-type tricarboxylate transporter receptor subunit TctC
MRIIGRLLVGLTVSMFFAWVAPIAPAEAQSWPQRPVKFILPLGPGSALDTAARLFAQHLGAIWGKPVVVENRPGGDGVVAISAFVGAHDDHVLMFSPVAAFMAHPYLYDKLPYDPHGLQPITRVCSGIYAVGVPEALKINSMAELVAMARAQPGKLNSASITGMLNFTFRGFLKSENLDVADVPYRSVVEAANDLAEGRVQIMLSAIAVLRPQVQNGRVKIIALTNRQRSDLAPGMPTVSEAGFPELTFDDVVGIFGPMDMPVELRERIAADVRTVAADPVIRERLAATAGLVVNPGSSADITASMDELRARTAAIAKLIGLKPAQ